jgi:hypothetical protein
MDGNTTRINRILRRSIRLPIPTHNSRPTHNSPAHNSPAHNSPAHSNRQLIQRQATIRMGQRNQFRRAISSL